MKLNRDSLITLVDKKNLVGCEIGVAEGKNALHILNELDIKMLYLIDPYEFHETKFPDAKEMKLVAYKSLKRYRYKTRWFEDLSENVAHKIPNDLDFVYIDGNHDYEYVKKDLELYYPKLKSGGIIACHDFNLSSVQEAIEDFFNSPTAFEFKNERTKIYIGKGGARTEAWVIKDE